MRLANTADEYGLISKLFHWSMALLMIAVYFLGKNLENNYQYYYEILIIHNTLGLLILLLAIFRLSWKWINILLLYISDDAEEYLLGEQGGLGIVTKRKKATQQ